jgi:hypothetical protein
MRSARRVILLIGTAAPLSALGCEEPRFDLTGTWTGGSSQDHSGREILTLRQDEDDITGLVYRISSGHRWGSHRGETERVGLVRAELHAHEQRGV